MAHHQANPIKRVFQLLSLEKRDVYIIFLLTIGSGLMAFAIPLAVQALVNIVVMGGVVKPLVVVSIILFILLGLSGALYLLEYYVVELIQRRIFVRTAIKSAEQAQAMDVSVYDTQNPTELMNRFFDVSTVQKTSYQLLTKGLAAALQAGIGALALMFYSFYFALVAILLLLMAWVVISIIGRLAVQSAIQESYAKYHLAAWLENIAYNLNIFKFGHGRDIALTQADKLAGDYLHKRRQHFSSLFKQNLMGVLMYALAGATMLGLGGWLVIKGEINLGQFVAAELIIFSVLSAFLNFISKLEYFYDLVAGLDKLGLILDMPVQRQTGQRTSLDVPPSVCAKGVFYGYSKHHIAIHAVSFSVPSNTNLAILAESGADRAFLAEILVGLRNPSAGVIEIDGVDIRQLDLAELRERVAFINHLEVLEGSILYNLTLGSDVSLQAVYSVLEQLGISTRIADLTEGLDTILLPRGLPLSRTELRLLMIARAVLSSPKLMVIDAILDEMDMVAVEAALRVLQFPNQSWTLIVLTQSEVISNYFTNVYRLSEKTGLA